ncbi:hypothetical protein [Haloarcula onubensis]|uniref:C2H2-type domain-containing protein n=1 Tax=Haloarcula onubensis TaxID=2950539 RepID=A0ABU2FKZ6_9EURY|nr:hypothetical protein [Halomicroarcula sp. S3CR25-11]MDS0280927.1 hypothetical protein [Halomicroarcula sp. S3CR25-11]
MTGIRVRSNSMRKSDSNEENSSAERSPEDVLSGCLIRYLAEEPVRREVNGKETSFPEDVIAKTEANLRDFESNCEALAQNDLESVLDGEVGSLDKLEDEDGEVQEFKIDSEAIWMLFGAMKYAGESDEEAAKLAYSYYYHHCENDEEARKFSTSPERYRQDRLRDAIEEFEMGDWLRWVRRNNSDFDSDDWKNWTNEPSDICHDLALAIIDIGCGLWEPEYASQLYEVDIPESSEVITSLYNGTSPSQHKITPVGDSERESDSGVHRYIPRKVVEEVLLEIDSRGEETYKKTLKNLRDAGMVKLAQIKVGEDYRIYPASLDDPPEAEKVWFEGESYVPETEPEPTEEEPEPKIMTDGGVSMDAPEAKQDLERIRKAREGSDETTDSPETFTCPIEGCSRTVIGSPDALRSHVRQSGKESHRHRSLNDALKIEFDEEGYHAEWGPQLPEDGDGRRESIYEPDDLWGPGVPESEVIQS